MADLSKLKVSLTKHGAHKVARLLRHYPAAEILQHTEGSISGVNIDLAQAKRTLSVSQGGDVPAFWERARQGGNQTIDNLVFLAVAFSHKILIDALKAAGTNHGTGDLDDSGLPDRKSFTNFKNDIEELGLAVTTNATHVAYDFSRVFNDQNLPSLAREIFELKLRTAGWDGATDLIDECVDHGFHQALAVSEEFFRGWITGGIASNETHPAREVADDSNELIGEYGFRSGHSKRAQGTQSRSSSGQVVEADLKHNELQDKLYAYLSRIHGSENVGTEVPSGTGGPIDVVLQQIDGGVFYEIKTENSIKACIREALSQLLEYSYWPDAARAKKLVIVSTNAPTKNAKSYLAFLRSRFDLPFYYQQIDDETGELLEEI